MKNTFKLTIRVMMFAITVSGSIGYASETTCYEEYVNALPAAKREESLARQARNEKIVGTTALVVTGAGVVSVVTAMAFTPGTEAINVGLTISSTAVSAATIAVAGAQSFLAVTRSEADFIESVRELEMHAYMGEGQWLRSLAYSSVKILAEVPELKSQKFDMELMEKATAKVIVEQPTICAATDRLVLFANIHNAAIKKYFEMRETSTKR